MTAIEAGEGKRKSTPLAEKTLANAPPCDVGLLRLVRAYSELATEKQIGMAVGPIPLSILWEWCDRYLPAHPLEAARFRAIMRAVDVTFLTRAARARVAAPAPGPRVR